MLNVFEKIKGIFNKKTLREWCEIEYGPLFAEAYDDLNQGISIEDPGTMMLIIDSIAQVREKYKGRIKH